MLKFWKKTGSKNSKSPANKSPTGSHTSLSHDFSTDTNEILTSEVTTFKYSRLSKPLVEIIRDAESLGYFIQYLEAMNVSALVKCLLDINHFNASTTTNRQVYWRDVQGVAKISDGLDFALACDISRFISEKKVSICAISEAKLSEMETLEMQILAVLENDQITETMADALKIFYKYFSFGAPFKIVLSTEVFTSLVCSLRSGDGNTFETVHSLILKVLEKEYYIRYLRSDSHCKYQMTILTSSQPLISDFLYNESALFYLMEFLELEGCRGLVEFWIAANVFQQQFDQSRQSYYVDHAQDDAMVLYNKYFSLQASHPLNLGDKIRFLVEERICRDGGPLPTCFEPVQNYIMVTLQNQMLKPFLQSQIYFKYLSELISAVNAGPTRPGSSDCSSEMSLPTSSSVTSENADYIRKKPNMEGELGDPDSLWKRSTAPGLSMGRVSSLGRFQTDLEPGPDRKIGLDRRISKAMKKFVKIEEDASKEELAWQVAEMIVKDVTSLTMPQHSDTL